MCVFLISKFTYQPCLICITVLLKNLFFQLKSLSGFNFVSIITNISTKSWTLLPNFKFETKFWGKLGTRTYQLMKKPDFEYLMLGFLSCVGAQINEDDKFSKVSTNNYWRLVTTTGWSNANGNCLCHKSRNEMLVHRDLLNWTCIFHAAGVTRVKRNLIFVNFANGTLLSAKAHEKRSEGVFKKISLILNLNNRREKIHRGKCSPKIPSL